MKEVLKYLLKHWISILPIILSLFSLIFAYVKGCQSDNRYNQLRYVDIGLQYRPFILLTDTPIIESYKLHFNPTAQKKHVFTDTATLESTISINFKVKLENKSNSKAIFIGYIVSDTVYGGPFIRETIINTNEFTKKCYLSDEKEFYESLEFSPYEIKTLPISVNLTSPTDTMVTIHLLCLYYNESKVLFDTYYWFRYNLHEIIMKYNGVDEIGRINYSVANKDLSSFFKIKDYNFSSQVYSYDDKIKIEKNIKSFCEKKYVPY